jgi:hypothetical protein
MENAKVIVDKINYNKKVSKEAFDATGLTENWNFRSILATTADLTTETEKWIESQGIVVWNKKFLAKHIWPSSIQMLGKRFQE